MTSNAEAKPGMNSLQYEGRHGPLLTAVPAVTVGRVFVHSIGLCRTVGSPLKVPYGSGTAPGALARYIWMFLF